MTDRSRWMALVVLCTGMLMIVLDMTIVNVALPSIQADLGFSQSSLAWVVNAYLITFAGLLLLAGRLGDLLGRRNVFVAGLGVFTVASLLCGLAANQEMLVAARFLQGVGGALTSAVILGHDRDHVPRPAGAGEGDRRLRLCRLRGRRGGPAGRRNPHPAPQLALDLHRQPAGRRGHRGSGPADDRARPGRGTASRSRRPRGDADHGRDDAQRLHDRRPGRAAGLAGRQDTRPRRLLAGPAGRLYCQAAMCAQPADAAADLRLAQRQRRCAGFSVTTRCRSGLPSCPSPS